MDRNPRFGEDAKFRTDAHKVANLLWETVGPNFSEFPQSYLSTLRHEYADGRVSMAELFDRVDLGPEATYEEYCEVFDALLDADPNEWPDPDSVVEVKTEQLLGYETQDFAEAFDFAEEGVGDISHKVEKFLCKVLASVYTDGVSDVTDEDGDPPGEGNNYLLSDDGTQFSGVFYDRGAEGNKTKEFPFTIKESKGGWSVVY